MKQSAQETDKIAKLIEINHIKKIEELLLSLESKMSELKIVEKL